MQATRKPRPRHAPETAAAPERPRADSVERMLAQAGDAWTFLILREAFFGVRRFDHFQANLGAAPNILTDRLKKLVANGLLTRHRYQERPARSEYWLARKGLDLYPVIVMMMRWGDRWLDDGKGAPLLLEHTPCGRISRPVVVCDCCGAPIAAGDMAWRPGPGAGARRSPGKRSRKKSAEPVAAVGSRPR